MSDIIEAAKNLRRVIFGTPMMATEADNIEKEIAAFLAGEEYDLRASLSAERAKVA